MSLIPQTDEERKLECVGDALWSVYVRLYVREFHPEAPVGLYSRVMERLVCNQSMTSIAKARGIPPVGRTMKGWANAFEIRVAENYYRHGFEYTKRYAFLLIGKHFNVTKLLADGALYPSQERERKSGAFGCATPQTSDAWS